MKNNVKSFWINLPVKDISVSRAFFNAIGFEEVPMHENNPDLAGFYLDENKTVMMLFPEGQFAGFSGNTVADTDKGTEALFNIDAPSRKEVDVFAEMVRKAGGKLFAEPSEVDGWMYAMGFCDPDGHRWSVLHMDMSRR